MGHWANSRRMLALKKGVHALHDKVQRQVLGREGIDVMAADWDTLLVLDACRYDVFEQYHDFDGELRRVTSRASSTPQWARANFHGQSFPDTVFIASNENVLQADAEFHDVVPLYDAEHRTPLWPDRYDDPPEVVMPKTVVEAARDASEEYPDKRLLVHFMQPHSPYVGPTGQDLYEEGTHWYRVLQRDPSLRDRYWQAYLENVDLVFEHVADLLPALSGKTVISADHGELFGEWGIYEHPPGVFLDALVRVPWFECVFDDRKEVVPGDSTVETGELTDELREHLEDLGYVDV